MLKSTDRCGKLHCYIVQHTRVGRKGAVPLIVSSGQSLVRGAPLWLGHFTQRLTKLEEGGGEERGWSEGVRWRDPAAKLDHGALNLEVPLVGSNLTLFVRQDQTRTVQDLQKHEDLVGVGCRSAVGELVVVRVQEGEKAVAIGSAMELGL
eukprot:2149217-Rhodomonas_salina.3